MERDLENRKDQFGVEMRERVKWDIREGIIGTESFEPKHAVIVTWKNMSFAGGIDNSLYKTNTFQMVLATDEVTTYVIFNYLDIQWTSHTEAGGDTTGGEGGVAAFVSIVVSFLCSRSILLFCYILLFYLGRFQCRKWYRKIRVQTILPEVNDSRSTG